MDDGVREVGMQLQQQIMKQSSLPLEWLRSTRREARSRWRMWRQPGWKTISAAEYQRIFERLGGSIHVHPDVVVLAAQMSGIQPRYVALYADDGAVSAALPILGGMLGATLDSLWSCGLLDREDRPEVTRLYMGHSEVILPIARVGQGVLRLPVPVGNLSCLHGNELSGLIPEEYHHMRVPSCSGEASTSRGEFIAKDSRKFRRFIKDGGTVESLRDWSAADIAQTYCCLFRARFGFAPRGEAELPFVLERLKPFIRGSVLRMQGKAAAIQIILAHATPRGLLVVGVNGGVDPAFQSHSPGTILYDLNIQETQREAMSLGLPLRFSFGTDADSFKYKHDWCEAEPLYRSP